MLYDLSFNYYQINKRQKFFYKPGESKCSDVLSREEDLELSLQGLLDLHGHHTVHAQLGQGHLLGDRLQVLDTCG